MTELLESLKRKRSSLKSKSTIFKNYLSGVNEPLDDAVVIEVRERTLKFQSLIEEYDEIQTEIDGLVENPESEFAQRAEFDKTYYAILAAAKKLLADASKTADQLSSTSFTNAEPKLNGIKLPVIELPKFDASYDFWLEYRDSFQSLIHENESIRDIQKFHYLRSSLTGSARQVIQSLEFTSANYGVAWDILCKRFNNFRLLVHNHVKALYNLEIITKEGSTKIRKLIDSVLKHLRALKLLKQPTQHWDTLIIFLITIKLDKITVREWEAHKADEEVPTLETLLQFLRARADMLETLETSHSEKSTESKPKQIARTLIAVKETCGICEGEHAVRDCNEFARLNLNDRAARAQLAKLCLNCLRKGHSSRFCRASSCRKCRGRHHTLIHRERPAGSADAATESAHIPSQSTAQNASVALSIHSSIGQVLLSTASLLVYDNHGQPHKIRAILDCGSQSSFITSRAWRILKLKLERANLAVSGVTNLASHSESKCLLKIFCNRGSFISSLSCFLLPQITGNLPNSKIDATDLEIPKGITLADPEFNIPGPIDLLIGADLFWNLISVGRITLGQNQPVLQKTKLGWVVSGPIGLNRSQHAVCNLTTNLEILVSKFWELEEFPDKKAYSNEELACQSNFSETHKRNGDGRFVVTIPFKRPISTLGDSLQQAKRRFRSLEKRLTADQNLKREYTNLMSEYQSLGHMTKVSENTMTSSPDFYMPHHGVIRASSATTKLRVVFDGSAQSSSGLSINDLQMVGPVIQNDLLSIILRFRKHSYVASSDIEKMYRQVLIEPSQRQFQRIVWRSDPQNPLEIFELNTVTYGTACASFVAIRCLSQLADECEDSFPNVARIIKNDFYVDDLITGAETVEELSKSCKQVADVLQGGCFTLRKWVSNDPRVLKLVSNSDNHATVRELGSPDNNKTLGIFWCPAEDVLSYHINMPFSNAVTKRTILTAVAQIFDPLGMLGPCIITAKIMLQQLWTEKLSWDQSVPPHVHSKWLKFKDELSILNELRIPRHVICKEPARVEIHGFSDASMEAFCACVYLRSIDAEGNTFVKLLCAKSKVAPLKKITIPRLELCGSLILARLLNKVLTSININLSLIALWCDSTIVLGWLRTSPNLLKTFVANRVAEIQSLTKAGDWRHVPTKDNPADILSRGVSPRELNHLTLWWHGPSWLSSSESDWPKFDLSNGELPELRQTSQSLINTHSAILDLSAFSNLTRLERVVAHCLRFLNNSRLPSEQREIGPITVPELRRALTQLIKIAQTGSFPNEIFNLKRGVGIGPKGKLSSLNPFLDENGILRVGGRLHNSHFEYEKRHPIILDGRSHLMKLIFKREHLRLLHPAPQLLMASIRDKFWPIAGRSVAKKIVHECVRCFRANPKLTYPQMGDLPGARITATFPFTVVGVDYAGPFLIKNKMGRGCKTSKAYLSLFVCFSTKAVHLELVNDLTKDAFILALRRFVSRRGKPSKLYSDNGTNFVGAKNELKTLGDFLKTNNSSLTEKLHHEGLEWSFIPAYSPHFGGLWEAGVKSAKHHLKRNVGNALLTFDQLYTVFVQIEAIMNSRPLSPLSSDPNDPLPITPAHFLVGRPLTSLPDPDLRHSRVNTLNHFQRLQQIVQNFWGRWAKEYVSELQQRRKWKSTTPNIQEGDLVIIKEQDLLPMKWLLGRVVQVHPGHDGTVRVVSIKTQNGLLKRAVSKVCVLPVSNDN